MWRATSQRSQKPKNLAERGATFYARILGESNESSYLKNDIVKIFELYFIQKQQIFLSNTLKLKKKGQI